MRLFGSPHCSHGSRAHQRRRRRRLRTRRAPSLRRTPKCRRHRRRPRRRRRIASLLLQDRLRHGVLHTGMAIAMLICLIRAPWICWHTWTTTNRPLLRPPMLAVRGLGFHTRTSLAQILSRLRARWVSRPGSTCRWTLLYRRRRCTPPPDHSRADKQLSRVAPNRIHTRLHAPSRRTPSPTL